MIALFAQIRKLKTTLILLITSRLRCKSKSKEHGLPAFDSRLFYNKGLLNLTADIKLHWVPQLPKNLIVLQYYKYKSETANWAESGKHQFRSEPSEILNLRSSTTPETVAFTPP